MKVLRSSFLYTACSDCALCYCTNTLSRSRTSAFGSHDSLVTAKPATVYGGVLSDHMDWGLEMLAAWNFNEVQGEAQGQRG
jgi:hypothetical protein